MEKLFLQLLNMSITAGWAILAVVVVRFFLRRAPKSVRCILWAVPALRLICPISIESVLSLIPSAETVKQEILYAQKPAIESGIEVINRAVNPVISESFAPNPWESINPMQIIVFVSSWIWIAGVILLLLHAAVGYVSLRRKTAVSIRLWDNVRICDAITSPFVFGIIKPHVYLPSDMEKVNVPYVTAHELAHIRRRDYWWKPIGYLLAAVYWFQPLVWLAYLLFCRDIEMACDELVIKEMSLDEKKAYSRALVSCSVSHWSVAGCPLAFGEIGVKERVSAVMKYRKPGFLAMLAVIVLCIFVFAGFLTNPSKADTENIKEDIHLWETEEDVSMEQQTVEVIMESAVIESELTLEGMTENVSEDMEETGLWGAGISKQISELDKIQQFDGADGAEAAIDGTIYDYRKNADGTWSARGNTYQYRLVLQGRKPDAAADDVFIVLTNREDLTYEDIYQHQTGSRMNNKYVMEDSLIVGWYTEMMGEDDEENLVAMTPTGHAEGDIPFMYVFFGKQLYRCKSDGIENGLEYVEENGLKLAGTIAAENNWELPDEELEASHISVGSYVYTAEDTDAIYVFDIWRTGGLLWKCEADKQ